MARRSSFRVTNGMRAAFCALRLCGLNFKDSADIVGVPVKSMQKVVPPDWREKCRPNRKWSGQLLADVRQVYEDPAMRLETIAGLFNTSPRLITHLAGYHGWKRKRRGPRPNPKGVRQMSTQQRTAYRKLRDEFGREAALEQVFP